MKTMLLVPGVKKKQYSLFASLLVVIWGMRCYFKTSNLDPTSYFKFLKLASLTSNAQIGLEQTPDFEIRNFYHFRPRQEHRPESGFQG